MAPPLTGAVLPRATPPRAALAPRPDVTGVQLSWGGRRQRTEGGGEIKQTPGDALGSYYSIRRRRQAFGGGVWLALLFNRKRWGRSRPPMGEAGLRVGSVVRDTLYTCSEAYFISRVLCSRSTENHW